MAKKRKAAKEKGCKVYTCIVCGKPTLSIQSMYRHILPVHGVSSAGNYSVVVFGSTAKAERYCKDVNKKLRSGIGKTLVKNKPSEVKSDAAGPKLHYIEGTLKIRIPITIGVAEILESVL